MTGQGIKITDLRPEIITLVNSNPEKYDVNGNGKIDEGDELSQLLSEYQCKPQDLSSSTNKSKKMMLTLEEKQKTDTGACTVMLGGVGTFIGIIGACAAEAGCLATLGAFAIPVAIGIGIGALLDHFTTKANVKTLKAKQSEQGREKIAERNSRETEFAKREAALQQKELEYKERMNSATKNIEKNISKADMKAKSVNKQLEKIKKSVTEKSDSVK